MKQRLYDLMDWEAIEAIVYSEEDHPQPRTRTAEGKGRYFSTGICAGSS